MISNPTAFAAWRARLLDAIEEYGMAAMEQGMAHKFGDLPDATNKRDAAHRRVLDIAYEPTAAKP